MCWPRVEGKIHCIPYVEPSDVPRLQQVHKSHRTAEESQTNLQLNLVLSIVFLCLCFWIFLSSVFALLYWYTFLGLILASTYTISWSDISGIISTLLISELLLVKNKSRMDFYFSVKWVSSLTTCSRQLSWQISSSCLHCSVPYLLVPCYTPQILSYYYY